MRDHNGRMYCCSCDRYFVREKDAATLAAEPSKAAAPAAAPTAAPTAPAPAAAAERPPAAAARAGPARAAAPAGDGDAVERSRQALLRKLSDLTAELAAETSPRRTRQLAKAVSAVADALDALTRLPAP